MTLADKHQQLGFGAVVDAAMPAKKKSFICTGQSAFTWSSNDTQPRCKTKEVQRQQTNKGAATSPGARLGPFQYSMQRKPLPSHCQLGPVLTHELLGDQRVSRAGKCLPFLFSAGQVNAILTPALILILRCKWPRG